MLTGNITIDSAAAGNTLTLAGPVYLNDSALSLSGPGAILISGQISGNTDSSIDDDGTANLTLTADNSGTYQGVTTMDGGTLTATADGAGASDSTTNVESGATLVFQGPLSYTTASSVNLADGATMESIGGNATIAPTNTAGMTWGEVSGFQSDAVPGSLSPIWARSAASPALILELMTTIRCLALVWRTAATTIDYFGKFYSSSPDFSFLSCINTAYGGQGSDNFAVTVDGAFSGWNYDSGDANYAATHPTGKALSAWAPTTTVGTTLSSSSPGTRTLTAGPPARQAPARGSPTSATAHPTTTGSAGPTIATR